MDHFYYGAGNFRDVDPGDWEPGKLPAHCRDVDRLYFGAGILRMWIQALFGVGRLLGEKIFCCMNIGWFYHQNINYQYWLFCEYWVLNQYEVGNLYLNGWLGEKRR